MPRKGWIGLSNRRGQISMPRPVDFDRYRGKRPEGDRFSIWLRTTAPLPNDPAIHRCALAYASAFVMNVVLCVALVPRFGGHGAAAATSISLAFETVLLFWIVRQRLGLHVLAFGKSGA